MNEIIKRIRKLNKKGVVTPTEKPKIVEDDSKIEVLRKDILTMLSGLKKPVDPKKLRYLEENLPKFGDNDVKILNTVIDIYLHPEKRRACLYLWNNKAEPVLRFLGLKVV